MELATNRKLEDLTNRWWDLNEKHVECPRLEDESDGISIKNIGGVFLVIAIGTALSLIAFVCEYYYYKIRPRSEAYKVGERNAIPRLGSEISLESVQIQANGDKQVSRDPDVTTSRDCSQPISDIGDKSTGSSVKFKNFCRRKNKSKSGKLGRSDSAEIPHANGHANGVVKSIFTYENNEYCNSRTELYPSLNEDGEIQKTFSEKL